MKVQGGEQKVMKKILTVALSTAMAFSMFASVAFGDSAVTPQQKFDALAAKGVFNGYPDKQAHLERDMTRAEFAKVLTKLLGLKELPDATPSYKDKGYDKKNWAFPFIEAVTAAGVMEGQDKEKGIFNYNGKVTVEEMATALVRALKIEAPEAGDNKASGWAKGYVQVAIDKGLISKDWNFQGNATREQLVYASYAADQFLNLSVASYKVAENGKDIEFTLNTGEVVKVTLEKALEPNKETEVTFENAAKQKITTKVTWKVDEATKVSTVEASNLKQVVVTFDGTVDPASAENINNYIVDGKAIDSVTVSEDKKTATILLDKDSTLTNQKKTFVQVSNVKGSVGTRTITQKVEFTPLDVKAPEVTEVKGLGTQAFKVKFSEPVKPEDMISTNFRIDDQAIAATVKYSYPDTAIVVTNMSEGNHTLRVSNVRDFSGLAIAPVAKEFTVTKDTEAPKFVSAKSYDLKKVTVEFDETIKSVSGAYANVSSVKASKITINDNKVTLEFAQPLGYTENTIHISGVKDYSDNSADIDAKVTPTLDTTRPTVVTSSLTQNTDTGRFIAEIKFSKAVLKEDAVKRENYVLKDADGIAKINGVNKDGNPVRQPELKADGKTVVIDFGSDLKDVDYTLTISGVRDTAYVGNVLLPQTVTLSAKNAATGQIDRAWKGNDGWIYVQFNKSLSVSGTGNAADPAKYTVDGRVLTTTAANVELVSTNTVRIKPDKALDLPTAPDYKIIKANYIQDVDGNYLREKGTGSYTLSAKIKKQDEAIMIDDVKITGTKEAKVTFDAPLSDVRADEFSLKHTDGRIYRANDYSLSSDNKTVTLKFESELPATFEGKLVVDGYYTRDAFGNIVNIKGFDVKNSVRPSFSEFGKVTRENYSTVAKYSIEVKLDKNVDVYSTAANLFTVQIGNYKVANVPTKEPITVSNQKQKDTLVLTFEVPKDTPNEEIRVSFNGDANNDSKAIVDANRNALSSFEKFHSAPTPVDNTTPGKAPEGVTASPATAAGNDGKITGVDATMEYKGSDNVWKAVTGNEVNGLTPGKYEVRVKAVDGKPASESVTVTVKGVAPAAPAVTGEDAPAGGKGKLLGLKKGMEYQLGGANSYTPVTEDGDVVVPAGTYYVRYAATDVLPESAPTPVVVKQL